MMSNSKTGTHKVSQGSVGNQTKKGGNSKLNIPNTDAHRPIREVKVINPDIGDVIPLPLLPAELRDMPSKSGGTTLDEILPGSGSSHLKSSSSGSFSRISLSAVSDGSILSKLSPKVRVTEDKLHPQDMNLNLPASSKKADGVKGNVEMWKLDIILTETSTFSLLDIPSTLNLQEVPHEENIKQRKNLAALCKNTIDNEISTQTMIGVPKNRSLQTDRHILIDKGTTATGWDVYDSFCAHDKISQNDEADHHHRTASTKIEQGKNDGRGSGDTEMETSADISHAEPHQEEILLSETFKHALLVMERNVLAKSVQSKLAAYRNLSILKDPDSMVEPELKEKSEKSSVTPTMKSLWTYAYELTRGYNVTSMTCGKTNPDVLAVGYGDADSNSQKPGFICCWSIKNPTHPERFFSCHRSVTSLDFSANNPSRLAVGMQDGSVAIYNLSPDKAACIASSSESPKRHLCPVWDVIWTKQELKFSGKETEELIISASEDGRITKWFLYNNCLDCIDVMKLKIRGGEKEKQGKKNTTNVQAAETSCRSLDFHPTESGLYLVSTLEGFIYKCSLSDNVNVLDTYKNHIGAVNHVEWSLFNPDVFLSCSSDFSIQVWKQGCLTPLLIVTSIPSKVCTAKWSPNCSAVFAALYNHRVEIWDLNSNILMPVSVHHAAPGVELTSLLFVRGSHSVLVGDSEGRVTVYMLTFLTSGADKQVDVLDAIQSGSK